MRANTQQLVDALVRLQRPDGSFEIITQDEEAVITQAARLTVHATLLDLLSMNTLVGMERVVKQLARHIADELAGTGTANMLRRVDTRAVFHALAALYRYDPALLPPQDIAVSVHFLTTREVSPGGPYINILEPDGKADRDTNIAIGRFLYQLGGPFPVLLRYVRGGGPSRYFTAGWAASLQRALLASAAHQKTKSFAEDTIDTRHTEYFYRDYYAVDQQWYGASAIVTARAIFAAGKKAEAKRIASPLDQRAVLARARSALPLSSDGTADAALARIIAADHYNEIGLFAVRFATALTSKRLPQQTLEILGAANILNWAAYTIYDDILDDDNGEALLPIANTALRSAVRLFKEAVPTAQFAKVVDAHFDAVDTANAWELGHCRFSVTSKSIRVGALPDYGDLRPVYERSLTHRLPLLATLKMAAMPSAPLADAFAQYLTIRQLSDDLHDWAEDLRAGHISYVVTRLLADAHISAGTHPFATLLPRLEKVFLHNTLPTMARELVDIAEQAHTTIRSVHGIDSANVLSELISIYEQSMRTVLTEYQNGVVLLATFSA